MFLIISVTIAVAMVSMSLIKRVGIKTVVDNPIAHKPEPFHSGVIVGGMVFGAGWAVTGACPRPDLRSKLCWGMADSTDARGWHARHVQ